MYDDGIVSPDDQGATFVELFFDLVFVFAITQITHFAAHHLDGPGLLRSIGIFWLIWWGWTQFTWALNAANTDHPHVRKGTLLATAVAFFMAVSVEGAFSEITREALWFAAAYVAVRIVGLTLYVMVAGEAAQRSAVRYFGLLSLGGLAAVLAGAFVDPGTRQWLWIAAILLDFAAAWLAGQRDSWGLHPGHFAERHGLIIIIALGESLIVAASGVSVGAATSLIVVAGLALLITCFVWWTYFGWIQAVLEMKLEHVDGSDRSKLGRDVYSFFHFPLVAGIIAMAVGFEAALHPADYTSGQAAAAIGIGVTLFLGSTALALWRAKRCILWSRLLVVVMTLAALALSVGSSVVQILVIAIVGLLLIVVIEQVTVRPRFEEARRSGAAATHA